MPIQASFVLLRLPVPPTRLAINPRLINMLCTVVKGRDLSIVRNIQRLAVFVLAGGMRIGQGFLGQCGDARGLIMIGAVFDFLLGAGQHVFAFVAA